MEMNRNSLRIGLASLTAAALLAASSGICRAATPKKGETFVIGTDAPLASVASFSVQIASINAVNTSTGASEPLLGSPEIVDFARFNGLQTLLDINSVPVGTYNQIVITIAQPNLGYLVTSAGNPPAIRYMTPTLTTTTVTKTLEHDLTVTTEEPVGIRMDFDLHKSILVSDGQITGTVDPTFNIGVVGPDAPGAYIDEFDTAVISTDPGSESFMVQGPHGRFWTIDTNGQTEWDGGATFGELNTNTIVQISGTLDRATSTITADEVTILSQNGFYAAGQNTYVTPTSGAASSFDLYVRALLPANGTGANGVKLGQIATIDLNGTEKYYVRWSGTRLPESISTLFFNSKALLAGQSIAIGGPATGAANATDVTVKRVTLRNWGYIGTVVKDSVNVGKDTFQMKVDGFAGQLIPQTVTVYLTGRTEFRYGYTGIHEISGGDSVRVVGLLIKNPVNGDAILVGKYVDALD
jgi:hypothetical protein